MGKVIDNNLTDKQSLFVTEYLRNGFNATKAAKAAGYSLATAYSIGSENLTKPEVRDAIKARLDTEGITPEKIKIALAEIAFGGDLAEVEDFLKSGATLTELQRCGVNTKLVKSAKVTTTGIALEMYSRVDALEKLGRVLAMFTDRHDVTTAGQPVNAGPDLTRLTPETRAKVADELGGPKA